jgi:tetratricopeptide (TPR) repeat protein
MGNAEMQDVDHFFYGSSAYGISLAVLAVIFISLFVIFRKRAIEHADMTRMRGKKANKVATKRLKKAAKLMANNKSSEFYDEVLRALWGYVGDKLNIPVAQLSRENISQRLSERQVDAAVITQFIEALDECEFQRYAPGDPKGNMQKVYDKAMTAISQIEKPQKSSRKFGSSSDSSEKDNVGANPTSGGFGPTVKGILVTLIITFACSGAFAQTKAEADSAYSAGNYQKAITLYETLLKSGASPELYYNLGNAYYRTENITRAVINYERALLLSPGDRDIRFNLQLARSKTIDKIVPESEMFFITWYHALVNLMSVDGWARMAILSLALVIILSLLYLFSDRIWLRKIGFFGGLLLLLLFVLSNVFAYQQKQNLLYRKGAIVIAPSVTVKSTPAKNGTDLFILHEGAKVTIIDGAMSDWKEIRLADGKEGWIERKAMEVI